MIIQFLELGDSTRISVSASMPPGVQVGRAKRGLTGVVGQIVNSISLRAQTQSTSINPTVSIGTGQNVSASDAGTRITQLQQLATLHSSGALTDAEFQTEKRRILENES